MDNAHFIVHCILRIVHYNFVHELNYVYVFRIFLNIGMHTASSDVMCLYGILALILCYIL